MTPPVDPWEVLRRLRALPLVDATTRDDDLNGADAVDELALAREILDRALVHAPARGPGIADATRTGDGQAVSPVPAASVR